jgi:uncharacterized membrane protein YoaK (UPF0700 family)
MLADPQHGPLPAVLLAMTVVTGMVDAVSLLTLGRVFVANMTGNIVFLGFAIVGTTGYELLASVAAVIGFLVGGRACRLIGGRRRQDRALLLRDALFGELALVALAAIVAASAGEPFGRLWSAVVAVVLAAGLGLQNAVARRLAVPDLTTTVLTMTLTGLAADAHPDRATWQRRGSAVFTMAVGAALGALVVRQAGAAAALGCCVAVLGLVAAVIVLVSRRPAVWRKQGIA